MLNQEPTTETVETFDPKAAFAAFAKKAAEHGFTSEIDDETQQPECYLLNVTKWEIQRIIVPRDYYKYLSANWAVAIDRVSNNPYQATRTDETYRTEFYKGALDITDLDFFEKLLLNIFPTSATPAPY